MRTLLALKVAEDEVEAKGRQQIVAEFLEEKAHQYWYVDSVNFDQETREYILLFNEMNLWQRYDWKFYGFQATDTMWY